MSTTSSGSGTWLIVAIIIGLAGVGYYGYQQGFEQATGGQSTQPVRTQPAQPVRTEPAAGAGTGALPPCPLQPDGRYIPPPPKLGGGPPTACRLPARSSEQTCFQPPR